MAGIYIHIPFCRKACHYCNFHFSTSLHRKPELLKALENEIQAGILPENVEIETSLNTIYFGGGTPSLLQNDEIDILLNAIKGRFTLNPNVEITLEANPDDINNQKLKEWLNAGINRLSIGVQSFFDADLQWMNRAHNAQQAAQCVQMAQQQGISNISLDLIYGTPTLTDTNWEYNIYKAIELGVKHLSCYALTVEENTALHHFIKHGKTVAPKEEKQEIQFELLLNRMQDAGFEHYEISNFAQPGHRSRHNTNYWTGAPYYGFGPGAHSFDGQLTRWWNIANNNLYISKLANGDPLFEMEKISQIQRINEKIMTGLRRQEGIFLDKENCTIEGSSISPLAWKHFLKNIENLMLNGFIKQEGQIIKLENKGKLFADGIAAKLFLD